jgi:DNA ligase-1
MKPLETSVRGEYDLGGAKPAVVFKPEVVWEVACADLSLSPIYTSAAGKVGDGTRGISLRFPRYIRTRDDKGVEDATDADQVAEAVRCPMIPFPSSELAPVRASSRRRRRRWSGPEATSRGR